MRSIEIINARRVAAVLLAMALAVVGCDVVSDMTGDEETVPPLPPPDPRQVSFSSYQPQQPYAEYTAGVLTRSRYETDSGNGYRVEIWDMLVGPHQESGSISLPGGAVVTTSSGQAAITIDGKAAVAATGTALTLSEGQTFTIANESDDPVTLRVYLFSAAP
jgi:hypothetical protein